MRKCALFFTLVLTFVFAALGSASAQRITLDRYKPAETTEDGFHVSRANDQGHMNFGAQFHFDYAVDPLTVERPSLLGTELFDIVDNHAVGHFVFSLGLFDSLVLFAGLPVTFLMDGDRSFAGSSADGGGVGDFYLGARYRLLGDRESMFALAAQGSISLPTARWFDDAQAYKGENSLTAHPEVVAELRPGFLIISANLGFLFRDHVAVLDRTMNHDLTYGFGATIPILKGDYRLNAHAEWFGAFSTGDIGDEIESHSELLAGAKFYTKNGLMAGLAAGLGLVDGIGDPDHRVVATVGWTAPVTVVEEGEIKIGPKDKDGDGILDDSDNCPDEAEDKDGFEDEDGCPDTDNDGDGIADANDAAPNDPEDKDGFEDEDGKPDVDNDQDGLLDASDDCPDEKGPAENRGCPDADRDGDGVVDRVDNCPDEPGTEENHGCKKKQQVVIRDDRLEILDKVFFRSGKDKIQKRSYALLTNVASVLNGHPEIKKVRVEGHTDSRGKHDFNVKLSQRRAEAVVAYLTGKGVDASRLEAKGFGPDKPVVADAKTKDEHAQNRRVEFNIVNKPVAAPEGGEAAPAE